MTVGVHASFFLYCASSVPDVSEDAGGDVSVLLESLSKCSGDDAVGQRWAVTADQRFDVTLDQLSDVTVHRPDETGGQRRGATPCQLYDVTVDQLCDVSAGR